MAPRGGPYATQSRCSIALKLKSDWLSASSRSVAGRMARTTAAVGAPGAQEGPGTYLAAAWGATCTFVSALRASGSTRW